MLVFLFQGDQLDPSIFVFPERRDCVSDFFCVDLGDEIDCHDDGIAVNGRIGLLIEDEDEAGETLAGSDDEDDDSDDEDASDIDEEAEDEEETVEESIKTGPNFPFSDKSVTVGRTQRVKNQVSKKKNKGVFLNALYTNFSFSNIIKNARKIFDETLVNSLISLNVECKHIKNSTMDNDLLSYYESGDFYKAHNDSAVFTILFYFFI